MISRTNDTSIVGPGSGFCRLWGAFRGLGALLVAFAVMSLGAGAVIAEDASLDDLLGLEEEAAAAEAERDEGAAADEEAPAPDATEELRLDVDLDDLALPTEAEGDVFQLAVADMKNAARRLTDSRDASIETQRVQQRVITRLDQLIEMCQEGDSDGEGEAGEPDTGSEQNQPQQQQQQADADDQGDEAAADEQATRGTAERADMEDQPLAERLSEWGNLPPRLRDQVMQGMEDSFSQLYRQLTERYYERLAEEQQ